MPRSKLLIAVIAGQHEEVKLSLTVSLLNLQVSLMQSDIETHLRVCTLNEALELADRMDADLFAAGPCIGVDPRFVIDALDQPHQVVAAVFPTGVSWDRVRASGNSGSGADGEPLQHRANEYSATPVPRPAVDGYVPALGAARLDCVVIKRGVTADLRARNPEATRGGRYAYESVDAAGRVMQPHETFCEMWQKPVWLDIKHPATNMTPGVFCGCVGRRHVLR
jgi:hypothetical protein